MAKPTLMVLSLGELGTHLLEAAARSQLFDTIIVASRDKAKAQARANNAVIGAGIEGFFPNIIAEELDFNAPGFGAKLDQIAPDYLFTAPSMLPWWKLDEAAASLPFAGYTALHLALMVALRDQMTEANFNGVWIGASYPDVINAVLNRTGYGPTCGIGNVQEPIAKIQSYVARIKGCSPNEVRVQLVAQHAFEYYVLNAPTPKELPPHLIKATVHGEDVSPIASQALWAPFPFPYDLHFNRVTASAGIRALQALTSESPQSIHLPGIGALLGGYPVQASTSGIVLDLPLEWSLDQAIAVNEQSLAWDGIKSVTEDGTIIYTPETCEGLHNLLGSTPGSLTTKNAAAQAQALLAVL
ncbi:hypothetical protein QEZ52_22180 (plasmid) [Aliisedimentitalea scapharcae]|uniref:Saccharopine dehydrogenase NADP binding domain-containing protein n=1 Tax=Aliisedimentitalea scapharcae TaxID=1524259 RepID=A0ABZ2XZC1_9RHOB